MNDEHKIIITFVFNRSGKKEMSFSEFYLTLSLDLKWFTPDNAKSFTLNSIEYNLLKKEKEQIKPNFNIDEVKIPTVFYPSKNVLFEKDFKNEKTIKIQDNNTLESILEKIVEKSNLDKKIIINQIKELEKEKNITAEIAAILVGKQYHIPFSELFKRIENQLF